MTEVRPATADFDAVYVEMAPLLRRAIWNVSGQEDLDDIVQDAFIKLWRSWNTFEDRSQRRTWAYRVAVNAAREHWRRQGRLRAALQRLWMAAPRSAAIPAPQEQGRQAARVAAALQALGREQREAVALVYLEGLSLAEAGLACGCPEGTIKSRLHHARGRLHELLSGEDGHG